MDNTAISEVPQYRTDESKRITEHEIAAAKLKLMGLMILAVVCAVIVVLSPP